MVEYTRYQYLNEVHQLIRVSRQLRNEGEISDAELIVINKHLGALKAVLKESTVVAPCGLKRAVTRVATY
jgi:hypothetical protein